MLPKKGEERQSVVYDPCRSNIPMVDSGLKEVTEQLHTIPAKHIIIRYHRHKYRCPANLSGLTAAPIAPRIASGSSLGNSFIIWTALSKFLYLTPSERCARMVVLHLRSHRGEEESKRESLQGQRKFPQPIGFRNIPK